MENEAAFHHREQAASAPVSQILPEFRSTSWLSEKRYRGAAESIGRAGVRSSFRPHVASRRRHNPLSDCFARPNRPDAPPATPQSPAPLAWVGSGDRPPPISGAPCLQL